MTDRPTASRFGGMLLLVTALVVGCADADRTPPATSSATASSNASAAAPSPSPVGLQGAHVRVLGLWSGPELDSFRTVASAWEQATGAVVDWEGTTDILSALATARAAGDPPDIAILPNLALMDQLADEHALIPLDTVLDMAAIERDYAPAWLDLGSHGGQLYGIFYKLTSKSAVWYSPKAFTVAGYAVPASWDKMLTLADTIVADGGTPFSVVAPAGPAKGWALTDWISAIVLGACGPEVYDRWVAAEIPWTDACIKRSFERFVDVVSTKGYVLGGSEGILATGDDTGADPLYTDPPTAWMSYLPSFAQAFIAAHHATLVPGEDYDVFPFPAIDPQVGPAVTIGADVPVLVTDDPASRAFMTYLASAPAQETWIKLGGFASVNRSISADTYLDPVARRVAEDLAAAQVIRFSAGDMLPASLQRAWWAAMVELVQDPSRLDAILERLTAAAKSAS